MTNHNTKQCNKCNEYLPATIEVFGKHRRSKDGLRWECKACRALYRKKNKKEKAAQDKAYYEKNKERIKMKSNKWYYDNHERAIETKRKWYKRNFEKASKYNKERYKDLEYRKKISDYQKSRREQNNKSHREWKRKNKDRVATLRQRRKNKIKGLEYNLTHEHWMGIVSHFNGECAYCGSDKYELTRDHFIPLSKGGEFTRNNIVPACRSCNSSKHNKDFFEWYKLYQHYSKEREQRLLKFLNYNTDKEQQMALF